MIQSMLLDSRLPKKFWREAVSTAVCLKNGSPSKALNNMTRFEAWHGEKPKVNHLRVFGCDHIPKDERGKFDSKTRKCVLVGYGAVTKGYRLFDVAEGKVIYSRDVHFNEQIKDLKDDGHKASNSDTDYQLII